MTNGKQEVVRFVPTSPSSLVKQVSENVPVAIVPISQTMAGLNPHGTKGTRQDVSDIYLNHAAGPILAVVTRQRK